MSPSFGFGKRAFKAAYNFRAKPTNPMLRGFQGANLAAAEALKKKFESMTVEERKRYVIEQHNAALRNEMARLREFEHKLAQRNYSLAEEHAIREVSEMILHSLHNINMDPHLRKTLAIALARGLAGELSQLPGNEYQKRELITKILANSQALKLMRQQAQKRIFRKSSVDNAIVEIREMVREVMEQQG